MKKYRIDVEEMPEEVEAIDLDDALRIAHENITIIECDDEWCEK